MTRGILLISMFALSGCNALSGPTDSITVPDSQVQPGLASCLATIGRADVAVAPDAPMTTAEITALLACTSERASR